MMKKYLLILLTAGILAGCENEDDNLPGPGDGDPNDRRVGASAGEILSGEQYESIEIEIQYMPGYEPAEATVSNLRNFLAGLANKSSGVQVRLAEVPASGAGALDMEKIREIESAHRTVYTEGRRLGIYLLITDGGYTDPNVLGVAYRNTSMALFGKTIHDNTGGLTQPSRVKLETTVMEHEFGHLMGLVDTGSPMQTDHQDPAHEGHCNNESCLMYYAAETTAILDFLAGDPVPALDQKCRNDLKANGGK